MRRLAAITRKLAALGLLFVLPACEGAEDPEAVRSPDREVPATDAAAGAASFSGPGAASFSEPAASPSADGAPVASPSGAAPGPAPAGSPSSTAPERGVILFLGTSLTEGYGLPNAPEDAFPAVVQQRIDRAGLPFRVVNAGVGGDTSAGGLRRLEWLLRTPIRVLVLELGANDGLRGQDTGALRDNLLAIIRDTRRRYPDAEILLAGMRAPPNLGQRYGESFRAVFPDVASAAGVALIPFLLEGVGGVRELNQADGIHPSEEGHEIIAGTVWASLEPVLRRIAPGGGQPNDPR